MSKFFEDHEFENDEVIQKNINGNIDLYCKGWILQRNYGALKIPSDVYLLDSADIGSWKCYFNFALLKV